MRAAAEALVIGKADAVDGRRRHDNDLFWLVRKDVGVGDDGLEVLLVLFEGDVLVVFSRGQGCVVGTKQYDEVGDLGNICIVRRRGQRKDAGQDLECLGGVVARQAAVDDIEAAHAVRRQGALQREAVLRLSGTLEERVAEEDDLRVRFGHGEYGGWRKCVAKESQTNSDGGMTWL